MILINLILLCLIIITNKLRIAAWLLVYWFDTQKDRETLHDTIKEVI